MKNGVKWRKGKNWAETFDMFVDTWLIKPVWDTKMGTRNKPEIIGYEVFAPPVFKDEIFNIYEEGKYNPKELFDAWDKDHARKSLIGYDGIVMDAFYGSRSEKRVEYDTTQFWKIDEEKHRRKIDEKGRKTKNSSIPDSELCRKIETSDNGYHAPGHYMNMEQPYSPDEVELLKSNNEAWESQGLMTERELSDKVKEIAEAGEKIMCSVDMPGLYTYNLSQKYLSNKKRQNPVKATKKVIEIGDRTGTHGF